MNDSMYNDVLDMWDEENTSDEQDICQIGNDFDNELLIDDRVWESYVEDIDGGDNFADYCEYFFGLLDEEEYFES